jgi:uncharacterized coiled-coil protein SlyX
MAPIHERLAAASSQNARLHQTLSETSYATTEYQQTNNLTNTLKRQIANDEKKLEELNHVLT